MKLTVKQYGDFFAQYTEHVCSNRLHTDGEVVKKDGSFLEYFDEDMHQDEQEIEVVGGWFVSDHESTSHLNNVAIVPLIKTWLESCAAPSLLIAEVPALKLIQFKKACEQMGVKLK